MPNVVGQSQSDAESTLKKQGISVIVVNKTPVTDPSQIGKVVKQDPAGGTLISTGISVTLRLEKNPDGGGSRGHRGQPGRCHQRPE